MKIKSTLKWIAAAVAAVVAMIFTFLFWEADPMQIRAPSDEKLIHVFENRRADFEKLRVLVTNNMHQKAYYSESNLKDVSPEETQNDLRSLMTLWKGLSVGVNADKGVRFIFASGRVLAVGPDWAKGIQFVPDTSRIIGDSRNTLDDVRRETPGLYVKEIEPHWYIFYQRDD